LLTHGSEGDESVEDEGYAVMAITDTVPLDGINSLQDLILSLSRINVVRNNRRGLRVRLEWGDFDLFNDWQLHGAAGYSNTRE
jgi:hypothetical protein